VVGPTGSGKSALGIRLAGRFAGEIISCDALQVYRRLDIGTGKVTPSERAGVPHHLLDLIEPDQEFSAADFVQSAAPLVREMDLRGKLPIIVGGTGLYLRSLRKGLFEGPGRVPEIRERLSEIALRRGSSYVHRILSRLDPVAAARIHENDLVRMSRALEVNLASRNKMSDMMLERRSPLKGYAFILVGLSPKRAELIKRIEQRVAKMFEAGFVDEVRSLVDELGAEITAFKAIGYREIVRFLQGDVSLDEARRLTVKSTVQYAKRQMTWFRREEGVRWFAGWGDDPELFQEACEYLQVEIERLSRIDSVRDEVSVATPASNSSTGDGAHERTPANG
jgi:tRNA dimethylallyltransferase